MFTCPKCKHDVKEPDSQICPHCRLSYFDDTYTTWIGSSLYCDIIFDTAETPPFAGAITYNEESKEYELVNMAGRGFPLYKNRKKVHDKEPIDIDDKIKVNNIIFDCNHPKISPIFLGGYKAQLEISYKNFEIFTVGNAQDADIILDELPEGKIYASIIRSKSSHFLYIPELGTPGPIFVDGFKLFPDELSLIDENDNIFIQDIKLPVYKIPGFIEPGSPFSARQQFPVTFEFGKKLMKAITIGQSNCDITLQSEKISHKHLSVKQVDSQNFLVQDNNSYNGVYLGEKRIQEAIVKPGDIVTFGNCQLEIYYNQGDIAFRISQLKGKIRIDALNITKKVKRRGGLLDFSDTAILNDVSLSIGAGELIGIMGPSGSGKTTLLKILAGVDKFGGKNLKGSVYYNYLNIKENRHIFENEISYLPQDDILFPDLTVGQCLYYSAKLRMPHLGKEEIGKLIDKALYNLNLETPGQAGAGSIRNRKIGSINNPGAISGGQRKRVNLAVELLSNPSILFLDEPTTGLSSMDSEKLTELLAQINNMGSTVITTIHQPGKEVIEKFDKVLILAPNGSLAYFGSLSKAVEFFESNSGIKMERQKNPASFILQALDAKPPEEWRHIYRYSEDYEYYIKRHQGRAEKRKKEGGKSRAEKANRPHSAWRQFNTLVSRYFRLKFNNAGALALLALQAPLIAALIGVIFFTPLFDGPLLETEDKPIEDYKRVNYYSQLSRVKKNFDYLPPYKKYFLSMHNQTGDSLWVYSQIIDSSRIGGGWEFIRSGPHLFSKAPVRSGNINAEEFPIEEGNYRIVISDNPRLSDKELVDIFSLQKDKNSFVFNDSSAINNWFALSAENKKRVWKEKILPERKKELNKEEFGEFKVADSSSLLSILNPFFDSGIMEPVKRHIYANEQGRHGWYDIQGGREALFTSEREYKEKAMANLYLFFVVIISFIWIGLTNSVKDIVLERPVLQRERLGRLKLSTYISSKFAALFIISIFQAGVFLAVLYSFVPDMPINIWHLAAVMLLALMIANGIGLIVSAASANIEFAISLLPVILIPQLLLAGVFKHVGAMAGALRAAADLTVSRWALEAAVNAVSDKVDIESPYINSIVPFKNIIYPCYNETNLESGVVLPGYFPYPIEANYFILLVFLILAFFAAAFTLKLKKY